MINTMGLILKTKGSHMHFLLTTKWHLFWSEHSKSNKGLRVGKTCVVDPSLH